MQIEPFTDAARPKISEMQLGNSMQVKDWNEQVLLAEHDWLSDVEPRTFC